MDYEKAYKEALAKCKAYIDDTQKRWSEEFCKATEEVFFEIFPELKEPEDERIKKSIIAIINNYVDNSNTFKPKMLAWLEKQGEQEQDPCEHCKDKCLNCHNFPCVDKREFEQDKSKKELREIEKQGKSKWTDDDEQYLLVCKNALRKYQMSDKWDADIISKWLEDKLKQGKQGEKKTKWTEEDEAHLHSVTTHLEQWIERHPNTCGADIQGENLAWLKGLKQRMEEPQ